MRKVVLIIGEVCSGKDTTAKTKYTGYKHIDVGDIVRNIVKRVERFHSKQLDCTIIDELHCKLEECKNCDVVVTGIRQMSIYNELQQYEPITLMLSCPTSILKSRYHDRHAQKDGFLTFEQVRQKDNELGLEELMNHIRNRKSTIIVKSY